MFISPQNHVLPRAFSLTESCSNNVAEYNALLIGLQLAHGMGVRYLEAYGDSKLIINQVKGEYEVRHEDLVPYMVQRLGRVGDESAESYSSRSTPRRVRVTSRST